MPRDLANGCLKAEAPYAESTEKPREWGAGPPGHARVWPRGPALFFSQELSGSPAGNHQVLGFSWEPLPWAMESPRRLEVTLLVQERRSCRFPGEYG